MQTFRVVTFLFAIFVWVVPLGATQADLVDFLTQRNVEDQDIHALLFQPEGKQACIKSKSHIICLESKKVSKSSPQLELAVFKTLQAQTKYQLAKAISKFIPRAIYGNMDAAASNFCEHVKADDYRLFGVETSTFKEGVQLFALAAIPLNGLTTNVEAISRSKQFSHDYCAFLFPTAQSRFKSGDYIGALEILKEAHDL